jgi:hypothetical protein
MMNFGDAIRVLKLGGKVARAGWNGKGMWLVLGTPDGRLAENGYPLLPFIAMKTADDKMLCGWLASQTDILSEDWVTVDDQESPLSEAAQTTLREGM